MRFQSMFSLVTMILTTGLFGALPQERVDCINTAKEEDFFSPRAEIVLNPGGELKGAATYRYGFSARDLHCIVADQTMPQNKGIAFQCEGKLLSFNKQIKLSVYESETNQALRLGLLELEGDSPIPLACSGSIRP